MRKLVSMIKFRKRYRVLIHGQNFFSIGLNGTLQAVGFWATRFVDSTSKENAMLLVIENIEHDVKIRSLTSSLGNPSLIEIDEIEEVGFWVRRFKPVKGYTFYMKETH